MAQLFSLGGFEHHDEFMQSVEEFMRQYLNERLVDEKREQASRAPFRRKFHMDDCRWDSRAGQLEMMHTERVLSISPSATKADVVTTREFPTIPGSVHQLRYHLESHNDSWLIREVDVWCLACHGEAGNSGCRFCHGTGWRSTSDFKI